MAGRVPWAVKAEVGLADWFVPPGARLDPGGPTEKEGDAVASFVDGALASTIGSGAMVSKFLDTLFPGVFRSVVGSVDDDGVLRQVLVVQEGKQPTEVPVRLDHELPVGSRLTLATKLLQRNDRFVG